MVLTLVFFVIGSVAGALHSTLWSTLPASHPISLLQAWGLPTALLAQLAAFAAIAALSMALERRRHGRLEVKPAAGSPAPGRLLSGPWPMVWGAAGLALLNFATLAVAGRPWGVTSAFVLWGSKTAAALGFDVYSWPYWSGVRAEVLRSSVFADITSVMNFGILLGALAGAGLAGKFAPQWRIPARSAIAAALGGILLGYGARLAYGCNIGAFLAGIASSSVHGWVWFASALAGTVLGVKLRPWFGLN